MPAGVARQDAAGGGAAEVAADSYAVPKLGQILRLGKTSAKRGRSPRSWPSSSTRSRRRHLTQGARAMIAAQAKELVDSVSKRVRDIADAVDLAPAVAHELDLITATDRHQRGDVRGGLRVDLPRRELERRHPDVDVVPAVGRHRRARVSTR